MIRRTLIALVAIAALVIPTGMAMAASDPTASQYNNDPKETSANAARSGLDSRVAGLPVTGLDLAALAGVALVLTGTGFALRKLSAPRPQ